AGGARLRRHALRNRPEIGCEPALVVLGQLLVAEQQDGVLVPGVLDLPQRVGVERTAQVDAADFRTDDRMQPGDRSRLDRLSYDCHVSLPSVPRLAAGRLVLCPANISGGPRRQKRSKAVAAFRRVDLTSGPCPRMDAPGP